MKYNNVVRNSRESVEALVEKVENLSSVNRTLIEENEVLKEEIRKLGGTHTPQALCPEVSEVKPAPKPAPAKLKAIEAAKPKLEPISKPETAKPALNSEAKVAPTKPKPKVAKPKPRAVRIGGSNLTSESTLLPSKPTLF